MVSLQMIRYSFLPIQLWDRRGRDYQMANTSKKSNTELDQFRDSLKKWIKKYEGEPDAFNEAMKSLLTALEYKDFEMMKAHLETARDSLLDKTITKIERFVSLSKQVLDDLDKRFFCSLNFVYDPIVPLETSFDETGNSLSELVDSMLSRIDKLMDAVTFFHTKNIGIPNASELVDQSNRWLSVQENVVGTWPWSYREPPPVDRNMIAESREAFKRGEGVAIEDLIRQLGGNPTKD